MKPDDMGSWKSTGTKSVYFSVCEGQVYFAAGTERSELYHVLTRRYYIHSTYQLYKRIIVDITGHFFHPSTLACKHKLYSPSHLTPTMTFHLHNEDGWMNITAFVRIASKYLL